MHLLSNSKPNGADLKKTSAQDSRKGAKRITCCYIDRFYEANKKSCSIVVQSVGENAIEDRSATTDLTIVRPCIGPMGIPTGSSSPLFANVKGVASRVVRGTRWGHAFLTQHRHS